MKSCSAAVTVLRRTYVGNLHYGFLWIWWSLLMICSAVKLNVLLGGGGEACFTMEA